jgi:dienelactone hydrolase
MGHRTRALLLLAATAVAAGCASDPTVTPRPTPVVATRSPTAIARASATPRATVTPEHVIPSLPGDPYHVPDPLPAGSPGDPIWAERVGAPAGAAAWRVLYRSETIHGDPIGVSGLVVAPTGDPPSGGWPVIGYAHGTTGLADRCAPSKAATPATSAASTAELPLPALWDRGFVVAATDYEGLGTPGRHPYLVGGSEARSVLDAVRAAQRIPDAHAGDAVVALGLSQGGHAALFTGEVAPVYAPELDLRGVVALAPGAELAHAAMLLANDPTAVGFAVAIGAGFAAAYPEARLEDVLTDRALKSIDVIDDGCIDDVLRAFARPAREVLDLQRIVSPPWPGLLEENTPGRRRTNAPVFVGQGTADPLVIPELTDLLVERLCQTGNAVTYRRYLGAGHGGVATAASADVEAWIAARLAGELGANDCR